MRVEVEFRKAIGTAIPSLFLLLNGNDDYVRPATISALAKLADHGESIIVCSLDIANVRTKSSFEKKLGRSFDHSLRY
jgi:HEAT repeat protein